MTCRPIETPSRCAHAGAVGELEVALEHLRDAVHASVTQGTPTGEPGNPVGESLSMPPFCTKR